MPKYLPRRKAVSAVMERLPFTISLMRLGVDLAVFPNTKIALVDELFITTQPAHLQKQFTEKLAAEERDLLRADMVRERLKNVERPNPKW